MASSNFRQCINRYTVVGVRGEHAEVHSVPGVQVFNTLIDRVAQDDEYLRRTLAPAARYDDFTVRHGLCGIPQYAF